VQNGIWERAFGKADQLLDWCKGERERLQRQLEMLKSGEFHIGENRGMGWVNISSESIERLTVAISELDRLLAEYETKASHAPRV
jgi:hypothetical protein